jgi:adenylate kinase
MLGVQGAGKGTQAGIIKNEYGIPHVSTGDLFRAMKTRDDDFARQIQEIMNAGALISDAITNQMVDERLSQPDSKDGVILDGFPRNVEQADWLEKFLASKGESVTAVILLELDLFTAFRRAFGRVKSESTGEFYNIYFNDDLVDVTFEEHPEKAYPPRIKATLKETGEALTRRADDEAAFVVKRIDIFQLTTSPLIEYYREKGLLVEIDANQSIAAVSQAIKAKISAASR